MPNIDPKLRTKYAKKKDAANTYRVKSGDTLSGIASKYGTSVANLYKYNPVLAKRKAAGKTTIFANTMIKVPSFTTGAGRSETARENRRLGIVKPATKPTAKKTTKPKVSKSTYDYINAVNQSALRGRPATRRNSMRGD